MNDYIKIKSLKPFSDVERIIVEFLNDNKIKIFAIIDHQRNAEEVSLVLDKNKVIIFGSPIVGTLLMQDNIDIAMELPLKICIYETEEKGTNIIYQNIKYLCKKYNINNIDVINKIDNLFNKIIKLV